MKTDQPSEHFCCFGVHILTSKSENFYGYVICLAPPILDSEYLGPDSKNLNEFGPIILRRYNFFKADEVKCKSKSGNNKDSRL